MRALVALLLAVPVSTLAQSSPDPAADGSWSLGAGVFTGLVFSSGGTVSPFDTSTSVPGATASLERRLASSTWLVLGLSASWDQARHDVTPGTVGISRDDGRGLTAIGGVRQALTGPGAAVEVSVLALAIAGDASREAPRRRRATTSRPGSCSRPVWSCGWRSDDGRDHSG